MTTKASIAGKPLLNSSSASWAFIEGTKPWISEFDMAPEDALAIAGGNGIIGGFTGSGPGSTGFRSEGLLIQPDEGNQVKANNIFLVSIQPGENKFISKVQISDRRLFWSYAWVLRRFNMRRHIGTKRLTANDQVPAVNPVGDLVSYWRWSLKDNKRPWRAIEAIRAVLDEVAEADAKHTGSKPQVKIDVALEAADDLPIEDLVIDDAGDEAINRILAYVPEAGIYIDEDGNYCVFSKTTGREKEIVKALQPEIAGLGHVDLVSNQTLRPKSIDVLFTRECEVRFDFFEEASALGTQTDLGDSRKCDNVLPSVDYQLTVSGQQICQGTYITFPQAFSAWGALPGGPRSLDFDLVRRGLCPGMDLWASICKAGSQPDNNGNIQPWTARLSAVQSCFRQLFRLNTRWTDRFLSLKAYRVATIDPTSGQRGPSLAYGDYSILYTQQTLIKQVKSANTQDGSPDWIINKTAYPSTGILDSSAVPSPGVVTVVDADQGIIKVEYLPNPIFGMNETILPSQVEVGTLPTADITNRTRPLTFDSVTRSQQAPRLSASFKMATVLSAVPASPNSKQQLHRITLLPQDVETLIGKNLGPCNGPTMEIRIGANVEVARVAWNDARSAEIEKVFGLTDGEPNLSGLCINEGVPAGLENGASLNAIAKGAAARVYAALVDRFEGSMAGYMNGKILPAGWATEIHHSLAPDGVATTAVKLPGKIPKIDLFAWLDSNTRQAILKTVQPL